MSGADDGSIELHRRIHTGRLLGEGGMGRVLDGFAPDLGQYLAVKVLRPENSDDLEVRERFDEEVAIMAMIDHPGNLPVYGKGRDAEGVPCYVMKKVEGRTFAEEIAERGADISNVPARRHLLAGLLSACDTIAYSHGIGIVHRDLKPENILIDRHDSVYVIDWGIAKRTGPGGSRSEATRTLPGKVMGSPGYMSPEQAEGRAASAGPQADVFALGVILYEVLTGRRPFGGAGGREEMLGAIHREVEDPRKGNWFLPRSLAAVCLKALDKDPARRYPDARALAADLRDHAEGRPVSALRPNPVERFQFFARRQPLRAAVILSVLVAVLVLVVFVGGQMMVDQRLSDKAMERLEEVDGKLLKLRIRTQELSGQLEDPGLDADGRARLTNELGKMETRWLLTEMEGLRLLREVDLLRFIRSDPELGAVGRERLFDFISTAFERGHYSFAAAVVGRTLERQAEGRLNIGMTAVDVARLKELAAEADRQANLPKK